MFEFAISGEVNSVSNDDAISRFLQCVEAGALVEEVFSDDVVLDATVPNWRFNALGKKAVRDELAEWYADPGHFESLTRRRIDGSDNVELVEFFLTWQEGGVRHGCHQAHVLRVQDGRIAADTAFCGGRWPAPLLEEMGAVN